MTETKFAASVIIPTCIWRDMLMQDLESREASDMSKDRIEIKAA
jgi:hypothetical protein